MALLNISQFANRVEPELIICKKCSGSMSEIPLKFLDLCKLVMSKKKIIKRYCCNDCLSEIISEK